MVAVVVVVTLFFVVLSENHNLHPVSDWCRRHKVLKITEQQSLACILHALHLSGILKRVSNSEPLGSLLPNGIITRHFNNAPPQQIIFGGFLKSRKIEFNEP